jgi:hypothetical protein
MARNRSRSRCTPKEASSSRPITHAVITRATSLKFVDLAATALLDRWHCHHQASAPLAFAQDVSESVVSITRSCSRPSPPNRITCPKTSPITITVPWKNAATRQRRLRRPQQNHPRHPSQSLPAFLHAIICRPHRRSFKKIALFALAAAATRCQCWQHQHHPPHSVHSTKLSPSLLTTPCPSSTSSAFSPTSPTPIPSCECLAVSLQRNSSSPSPFLAPASRR